MKRKDIIKITIIIIIALIFFGVYLWEKSYAESLNMTIELTPNPAPADGATNVNIVVQVLDKNGKPRAGDVLFMLSGFGIVAPYRTVTDSKGEAHFTYRMWTAGIVHGAEDTWFRVTNESNSTLIAVPARIEETLFVTLPKGNINKENVMTPENMFSLDENENVEKKND